MGICRGSDVARRRFCQARRELEPADDRGLTAAATLGDLIEAGSVVICPRLQALA
jgi:hypothetical protein